jgi:hypothetical protein
MLAVIDMDLVSIKADPASGAGIVLEKKEGGEVHLRIGDFSNASAAEWIASMEQAKLSAPAGTEPSGADSPPPPPVLSPASARRASAGKGLFVAAQAPDAVAAKLEAAFAENDGAQLGALLAAELGYLDVLDHGATLKFWRAVPNSDVTDVADTVVSGLEKQAAEKTIAGGEQATRLRQVAAVLQAAERPEKAALLLQAAVLAFRAAAAEAGLGAGDPGDAGAENVRLTMVWTKGAVDAQIALAHAQKAAGDTAEATATLSAAMAECQLVHGEGGQETGAARAALGAWEKAARDGEKAAKDQDFFSAMKRQQEEAAAEKASAMTPEELAEKDKKGVHEKRKSQMLQRQMKGYGGGGGGAKARASLTGGGGRGRGRGARSSLMAKSRMSLEMDSLPAGGAGGDGGDESPSPPPAAE